MKSYLQWLIALTMVGWVGAGMASETRVVINLSEQRAYLIEQGRVALVSPIASGKPGWPTPTGDFQIFKMPRDLAAMFFDEVHIGTRVTVGLEASGRFWIIGEEWSTQTQLPVVMCPLAVTIGPRRCRTSWNLARQLGCTQVTFQGIPLPTDAYGCLATL